MITLGVDLASKPTNTAACIVDWREDAADVISISLGLTDPEILALASGCGAIGIDAPFGWPRPFVELVSHDPKVRRTLPDWLDDHRIRLMYRQTDLVVWRTHRQRPLSVSCDWIAFAAMRCAGLLDALGVVDRSGDERVFEVYPAVALKVWGFEPKGYKGRDGEPKRRGLIADLRVACPWLRLTDDAISCCLRSDDAFDALIASLVARAAAIGMTERPPETNAAVARLEGWIAVPRSDALGQLVTSRRAVD